MIYDLSVFDYTLQSYGK